MSTTALEEHRLQPLLSPRSVALVGASQRADSIGDLMVRSMRDGGYSGRLYAVNPRYEEVSGVACYPSLDALPEPVDLAVLNLAGHRLEAMMSEAIGLGARAFVIFDPCMNPGEPAPKLLDRLRAIAREADVPVCGGNGMGFMNLDARVHAGMFVLPPRPTGPVTLIAHSGSVFMFSNAQAPNYFNLSVSAGQEIGTTVDEYLDYALEMPSTRAVALFVETLRSPQGFRDGLAKAQTLGIAVVACKVGRTETSARQALSHTGAIAGDGDAFDALLARYGAIRTDTLEQLLATATLLTSPRKAPAMGFGLFTDSGGLCALAGDRADAHRLPFCDLARQTLESLSELMPLSTPANPLDAMIVSDEHFIDTYRRAYRVMAADPAIGLFGVETFNDDRYGESRFMTIDAALDVHATTDKPMFIMSGYTGFPQENMTAKCHEAGVPLIFGLDNALIAARNFLAYHHRCDGDWQPDTDVAAEIRDKWRVALSETDTLGEQLTLEMLADFSVPVVETRPAASEPEAVDAASSLGFPVALKTAEPDIHHKSDVDGVRLALRDAAEVQAAYADLSSRLGNRVLVSAMAEDGVELALGMFTDPTVGPVLALGAGGTLVEHFEERAFAIPPFGAAKAAVLINGLSLSRVLAGVRGRPAADVAALAKTVARFSVLCAALSAEIAELDVNPLIVGSRGAVAVDGLTVTHRALPRVGEQP